MENAIQEAKKLFNETWDLLDLPQRTDEEKITMLHKAHTSCYLWREAGQPVNNARGEWQVSRVYSVLKMGEPALLHGLSSLSICRENGIGGLDLAFGYEAVARAYACLGDGENMDKMKALGVQACEAIAGADDRDYAQKEIDGIGR